MISNTWIVQGKHMCLHISILKFHSNENTTQSKVRKQTSYNKTSSVIIKLIHVLQNAYICNGCRLKNDYIDTEQ